MPTPMNPFSQPPPSQGPPDKQTYMPPSIEKAMKREQLEENGTIPPGMPGAVTGPDAAPVATPATPATTPTSEVTVSPASPNPDQPYDFITNPDAPPKKSLMASLPGGGSIAVRVGFVAGGLLILMIIFAILKSILGGGPDFTSLISVVQDQQEIIHLTSESTHQPGLSTVNQNSVATIQIAVTSSKSELISYLITNHQKIKVTQLTMKISATTDNQLTAAASAGTYDQTFHQVLTEEINTYSADLRKAYQQYKGTKGRALLKDSYDQAQLFLTQLNSPAN